MKRKFASLLFVFGFLALMVAACGDKIVVPADKSGKCVAGLLTKCGDTCVDTQTDIANCGSCMLACTGAKICVQGKCTDSCPPGSTQGGDSCVNTDLDRGNCGMCGKACAGNEVCAKGKCAATCEAVGYKTCAGMMSPIDAGGGAMNCVDPSNDNNNCSACGVKCMSGEACSNGVCCVTGLTGCAGQCVDAQSDPNNCNGCGIKCGMMTPNCFLGACSKCNNKILILADNQTAVNVNMKKSFQSVGFSTTLIDSGASSYTGMPAATDFGAVVIVRIGVINVDMPVNGQQALTSAQQAGTGMIFDAYVAYDYTAQNHLQTLKSIGLYTSPSGVGTVGTVSVIGNQFPFFAGISTSFATVNTNAWFPPTAIMNGGVQFAQLNYGPVIPAAYSRSNPNGRIVHYSFGINWQGGAQNIWTNDPTQVTWVLNGVRWAAGCTN